MKIFDISMPIHSQMPVYKNKQEKRPVIEITRDIDQGARESRITMDMHTGTHMDAPMHMIKGGRDISCYSLDDFVGPCIVLDFSHLDDAITKGDLENKEFETGSFVLLKTRNSMEDVFNPAFVYLESSGAAYLAEKGVRGVGIDAPGIERNQPGHETHKILLEWGIMILEGLRLKGVGEGHYTLIALPLNIPGAEAAPVRAVLLERNAY